MIFLYHWAGFCALFSVGFSFVAWLGLDPKRQTQHEATALFLLVFACVIFVAALVVTLL